MNSLGVEAKPEALGQERHRVGGREAVLGDVGVVRDTRILGDQLLPIGGTERSTRALHLLGRQAPVEFEEPRRVRVDGEREEIAVDRRLVDPEQ